MWVNELIKDENFLIVIVDDTVEYLKLLSDILTNEGYLVRSFNSGELALHSIKENQPSLILLDSAMPVMDGYEVCRQLKADENTCDIPVIFISESGDKESMLTGFQIGGVDFINKPFRKEEVLARVKTHISLFHFQLDLKIKNEILQDEIMKSKEAESALVESEERFRTTLYSIGDGVITTDPTGKVSMMNPVAEQLTGWSQTDATGKILEEVFRIINEEIREQVEIPVRKVLREGVIVGLANHTLLIAKDGTERPIADSGAPIRNENGETIGVVLVFQDQTEERKAEKKILESEFFFRESQRAAYLGSYKFDIVTGFWDSSDVLDHIFGIGKEYVKDINGWKDLILVDDLEMMDKHLNEDVLGKRKPFNKEYRIVRKSDGIIRWVNGLGQLNLDAGGNILSLIGTIQDITKRKRTEDVLKESEEMMRNSQSVAHICSYSTNLNENEIGTSSWICSPEFYKIFGIDKTYPHTIEGWVGFIHPDYREETVAYHEYVIKERIPFEHEYKIIRINDGAERWVYGTGKLEFDEKGNPIRMHGAIQDITERKMNLEAIQNERQLLRTLIDHLPDPIYVKDNEGRKMLANRADLENIGVMDESEVLGKSDLELFNTEIGYRGYEDDLIVIEKGEPVINREEIFIDKNGKKRWLLTTKIPILNKSGKTTGLVGIGRDITEQKKAYETIQKLSKSIEQSPSTIVIADVLGNIEYVNPKFREITGYTTEEVIGQNPRILQSGETPAEKYKELWDTISSGEVWRGEFRNRKKNGELFWEWVTMTSIKDNQGEITNYIAIKEDISSRKQMEVDLIIAKEKAEENDRLKSAFLANMSHEIRTPLNSIIGFAELLSDPDFELGERYEFASLISASGNNLLAIITDIMDISKIEAGQVVVNKSVFNAHKLIHDVHNEYKFRAHDKGIEMRIASATPDEDCSIYSDQIKIKQVLINFVGNALKFTENGFIEIGLKVNNESVEFFVKDTGLGISVAHREKIFERFRQVEDSSTRKYGGNGLGLAISKSLIEMLDGTIGMESEPGKGSTFYFTLTKQIEINNTGLPL